MLCQDGSLKEGEITGNYCNPEKFHSELAFLQIFEEWEDLLKGEYCWKGKRSEQRCRDKALNFCVNTMREV